MRAPISAMERGGDTQWCCSEPEFIVGYMCLYSVLGRLVMLDYKDWVYRHINKRIHFATSIACSSWLNLLSWSSLAIFKALFILRHPDNQIFYANQSTTAWPTGFSQACYFFWWLTVLGSPGSWLLHMKFAALGAHRMEVAWRYNLHHGGAEGFVLLVWITCMLVFYHEIWTAKI